MGKLTIWQNSQKKEVSFEGQPVLQTVLAGAGMGVDLPCGGAGRCGKCRVRLEGAVSEPNEAERRAGGRLSCQAVLLGDAQVYLEDERENRIEASAWEGTSGTPMGSGYGAALDIGTTTVVLNIYRFADGKRLASAARMNPQRSVAADVMGRIGAALEGQAAYLQNSIQEAIRQLMEEACAKAGIAVDEVTVTVAAGNTTMLYLLTGENPDCLSHAPFAADDLFGRRETCGGFAMYLPTCMNAFVGADITCAVLASSMCLKEETSLLCDIGTNGEMALWKDGRLFVTSTAAGPAFEGAGISCGCGSVDGAVDKVWVEDGSIKAHTIGEAPAVGVCGSGLIDAVAAYLETELVDETGASEEDTLPLRDGVCLLPKDIRAVQLAKASIAAGIQTLLELAKISVEEVATLYIAGGFGSHLNVSSAAKIGLIPAELEERVQVIGNGALKGAAAMLTDVKQAEEGERLASQSDYVNLGGNPLFNEHYIDQMFFE